MSTQRRPTLEETVAFIKGPRLRLNKTELQPHLENLFYMKSVLYVDDKNNPKHLNRIHAVLEALKKAFSKELNEAPQAEGMIFLVSQIFLANKILDAGIARLKEKRDQEDEPLTQALEPQQETEPRSSSQE